VLALAKVVEVMVSNIAALIKIGRIIHSPSLLAFDELLWSTIENH
jgi:hypothetical protein